GTVSCAEVPLTHVSTSAITHVQLRLCSSPAPITQSPNAKRFSPFVRACLKSPSLLLNRPGRDGCSISERDCLWKNARLISQPASRDITVKILGMIGGTGPESTVEYYRRLIAAFQKRMKTTDHVPPIIINSVDYRKLVDWFIANELAQVTEFLVTEIERLERAGADFALIAANTPHLVFDELQRRLHIPLLSIIEATADAAAAARLRRPAL